MLNLAKCVIKQASNQKLSEAVLSLEEGVPLVRVMENGVMVAGISTGVADEVFLGFSQNRHITPDNAPRTEVVSVPGAAPYTVTLSKVPTSAANFSASIAGTQANVVGGAPVAGEVNRVGAVLTFNAADAGKEVEVLYRYALTQVEAALLFGRDLTSFSRLPEVETSLIEVGRVFTDRYIMSDDWANADKAYLAADGYLTTDDSTGTFAGVVSALPSVSDGYLGIDVSI